MTGGVDHSGMARTSKGAGGRRPSQEETIHSGHFMKSQYDADTGTDGDDEVGEVDVCGDDDVDPSGQQEGMAGESESSNVKDEMPVTFYKFGPERTRSIAIDVSLGKLNRAISMAYDKLTTPKWKDFKGLKLHYKQRIRLNNVIWRTWHMEFGVLIRGRLNSQPMALRRYQSPYCFFALPEEDQHKKLEGAILEGMYWKRRQEAVKAQYKRWRHYQTKKFKENALKNRTVPLWCRFCEKTQCDVYIPVPSSSKCGTSNGCPIHQGKMTTTDDININAGGGGRRERTLSLNYDAAGNAIGLVGSGYPFDDDDDLHNVFTDRLFDSLKEPYMFPDPKEMAQLGNADFIQPGLLQLQPSLEEIMASLDAPFLNDDPGSISCLTPGNSAASNHSSAGTPSLQRTSRYSGGERLVLPSSSADAAPVTPTHDQTQMMPLQRQSSPHYTQASYQLTVNEADAYNVAGGDSVASPPYLPQLATLTPMSHGTLVSGGAHPTVGGWLCPPLSSHHQQQSQRVSMPSHQMQPQMPSMLERVLMSKGALKSFDDSAAASAGRRASVSHSRQQPHPTASQQQQPVQQQQQLHHSRTAPSLLVPPSVAAVIAPPPKKRRTVRRTPKTAAAATAVVTRQEVAPSSSKPATLQPAAVKLAEQQPTTTITTTDYRRSELPSAAVNTTAHGGLVSMSPALTSLPFYTMPPSHLQQQYSTFQQQFPIVASAPGGVPVGSSVAAQSSPFMLTMSPSGGVLPLAVQLSYPSLVSSLAPTLTTNVMGGFGSAFVKQESPPTPSGKLPLQRYHQQNYQQSVPKPPAYTTLPPTITAPSSSTPVTDHTVSGSAGSNDQSSSSRSVAVLPSSSMSVEAKGDMESHLDLDSAERKRIQHLYAEQSRRCALKDGYDQLMEILPNLYSGGTKPTNAVVLAKSGEFVRELKENNNSQKNEVKRLKEEIQRLNDKISVLQTNLPSSSTAKGGGKAFDGGGGSMDAKAQRTILQQNLDTYTKDRSRQRWRFWLLNQVTSKLLESFAEEVVGASTGDLSQSAANWAAQSCTPVKMRPAASDLLVRLATSTKVLTNPGCLVDYVQEELKKV